MNFVLRHPVEIAWRTLEHVELVTIALAVACAIALPVGIFVARNRRLGDVVLGGLNILYTIPSLALLALLVAALGLGQLTAIVALVVYAQMILIRGVVAGLRGVDAALIDAARGLGFTARQTLLRVEFPAALPVVLGGVRVATVSLVALATVAAWINAGGLGVLLFEGIGTNNPQKIFAGALAAAVLAVAADLSLRAAERAVRT